MLENESSNSVARIRLNFVMSFPIKERIENTILDIDLIIVAENAPTREVCVKFCLNRMVKMYAVPI
jgi:hypothetical protein